MRYLIGGGLLLLAGIAAVAFFALQALLDEARLRARINDAVLASTGHALEAEGGVDLQFLPQPVVTVHRPRLGGAAEGFILSADRLDLDVALRPLLLGAVAVDAANLVRPELRLAADLRGALESMADQLAARGSGLPMRRLGIAGGTVATLPGEPLLRDVEGVVERESEAGGSRFRVQAQPVDSPLVLRLEGGLGSGAADQPLPLQLDLEAATRGLAYRLGFRGQARPAAASRGFAGQVTLDLPSPAASLAADLASTWPPLARLPLPETSLRLAADLTAEVGREAAPRLQLEQATLETAGQSLTGDLSFEGGAIPTIDLRLETERLVVDGPGAGSAALAGRLLDSLPPELRGPLALRAAVVEWRDRTFRRVALDLALDGRGMVDVASATAVLPGPGDLAFTGRFGPLDDRSGRSLTGTLEVALQNPGELAAAFIAPPALLEGSTTLALETDLDWQAAGITLRNADLRLDALQAVGGLAYRAAEAEGVLPQLALSGAIDRLALDDVVDPRAPERTLDDAVDFAISTDLAIDLRIARTSLGGARFGSLTARLDSTNGVVGIERLSLNDVAGSAANASGRFHAPSRTFDLDLALDIASLPRLLRLADVEPPLALALLGPLNLRGDLAGDADRAELSGRLEADLFAAEGVASITDWRARPSAALAVSLEADEAAPLIRQFGGVAVTDPLVQGPLGAELEIDIDEGDVRGVGLELTSGRLVLALEAMRTVADSGPLDRFAVDLGPLTAETAALLYQLATPPLDLLPGPPARWRGYWPARDLTWDWLQAHEADLAVTLRGIDSETPPIEITGQLRDGSLTVPAFRWAGEAGLIDAGIALASRADGRGVDLTVDLAMQRFAAGVALTALGIDPRALGGTLDLEARLATHGASLREQIGQLEGAVDLVLSDGVLGAASAADGGIRIDRLDGTLEVERGVVAPASEPLDFTGPDGIGRIDGYADLLAWIVDLDLDLDGHNGAPLVRQRLFGSLADPGILPREPALQSEDQQERPPPVPVE